MEESIGFMKRIHTALPALLLAVLLVFCAAPASAEGEGEAAASCAHENTKKVYYFDTPTYIPMDGENHVVSGLAFVDTVCEDCGEVIGTDVEYDALEIRPHVFRNGVCALCGRAEDVQPEPAEEAYEPFVPYEPQEEEYREADQEAYAEADEEYGYEVPAAEEEYYGEAYKPYEAEGNGGAEAAALPVPAEVVVMIPAGAGNPDQYFCTLTEKDLENAGQTLVLWPEGCDAALVLPAGELRETIESTGGTLTAEIERPGRQNVRTSLRLYDAAGGESRPGTSGISLRIYGENNGSSLWVSYTNPDGAVHSEEASWEQSGGNGYWTVRWLGDGSYTY